MGKKAPAKKGGTGGDGAAARGDDDGHVSGTSTSTLTPRAIRQRTWAKRVDDAVTAMRQVQQLLQLHAGEVDMVKKELEELTNTAAALWSANVEELPAQFKEKQRPLSQRSNSPAGSGGRSNDATPTKQRAGPDTASFSGIAGEDGSAAASYAAGLESVEQTLLQLSAAQRAKVSVSLQALFYAAPSTASAVVVVDGPSVDAAGDASAAAAAAAQRKQTPPVKSAKASTAASVSSALVPPAMSAAAAAAAADSDRPASANGRRNGIPPSLFFAMRELQTRRSHLEAQLTGAANSTAQQLRRFQLLQEELLVAQYALDAARRDPQQELQQQMQQQQQLLQQQRLLQQQQQQQDSSESAPATA